MSTTDSWPNTSQRKVLNSEYGDLLSNLKRTVLSLTCPQKIELCKAWIQRFLTCVPHENYARNILIDNLNKQLLASTDANLEYPFMVIANTDLSLIYIVEEIRRRKIGHRCSAESINQLQISVEDCQFIGSDCVAQIQDLNRFITEITEINKNLTKELEITKRERDELRKTNAKWQKEFEESASKRLEGSFDRYLRTCDSCAMYKAQVEQANGDLQYIQEALQYSRLQQSEEKITNCKKICAALNTIENHLLSANPLENLKTGKAFSQIFDNDIISEDIKSELVQREERIGCLFADIVRSVQIEEQPAGTLEMITKKYKRQNKRMLRKLHEQENKIANMQRDDAIKEQAHAIRYATLKSEIVLQNGAKQTTDLGNLINSLNSHYHDLIDKNLQLDDSFVV